MVNPVLALSTEIRKQGHFFAVSKCKWLIFGMLERGSDPLFDEILNLLKRVCFLGGFVFPEAKDAGEAESDSRTVTS